MNISGMQKTSFIDYPGELATVLFTSGCNFRCPYCHNAELLKENQKKLDVDWIKWLKSRKKNIDAVVISGGEPTLQEGLIDFIKLLKQEQFKVKLDTNGTAPEILEYLFQENLIDYIAMDLKGTLNVYKKIVNSNQLIEKVKKSINLIKQFAPDYEFRTTLTEDILFECIKDENLDELLELLKGAKKYYIQNFKDSENVLVGKGKLKSVSDLDLKKIKNKFEPIVLEFGIR